MTETLKPGYVNGELAKGYEGATVDAYVDAMDVYLDGFRSTHVTINNTDSTNALKFTLYVSTVRSLTEIEDVAETELTAGVPYNWSSIIPWDRIRVKVKSSTGSAPADYEVGFKGTKF